MICWLSISSDQYPALNKGLPFTGLLSRDEQAMFDRLKTPKRRQDWLLGRLAAKKLIQAVIYQKTGNCCSLDELVIAAHASHAPYLVGEAGKWINLSLSHAGSRAVSAVVDQPSREIGIDIEQIERRPEGFAQEFFTENEINLMRTAKDAYTNELLLAGIWSAKEAVFKALQVGLSVNTKAVTCLFDINDLPKETWRQFEIQINHHRLLQQGAALQGWLRYENGYVITLVVQNHTQESCHDERIRFLRPGTFETEGGWARHSERG